MAGDTGMLEVVWANNIWVCQIYGQFNTETDDQAP